MDRYMSVGDAAKALGVVPATVKLMLRNGRLTPAARTVGGNYLFDPAEIERLASDRKRQRGQSDRRQSQKASQEKTHEP
jgi:excisionase family DNA binding protein